MPRGQSVLYYELIKRAAEKSKPSHAAVSLLIDYRDCCLACLFEQPSSEIIMKRPLAGCSIPVPRVYQLFTPMCICYKSLNLSFDLAYPCR